MIVALYIYIDGIAKRIELFDDEKISVTSSIQNINDISKVFTDYSQSFTIPASTTNNETFKYWYENSLENGYDQRITYQGYIEIDTQIFRVGRWQLESVSIKNRIVENYKLTFYGNLKALTDKFGEDKLSDVRALNNYSVTYSPANVLTRLTSTVVSDVGFPLISSKRYWGTESVSSDSPTNPSGAIQYDELFPAVQLTNILSAIQDQYFINFNSSFFEQERFSRLYCWFKKNEAEKYVFKSAPKRIIFPTSQSDDNFETNSTTNILRVNSFTNEAIFYLTISVPTTQTLTLSVYKNGTFLRNIERRGTSLIFNINRTLGTGDYYFEITNGYSDTSVTYSYSYEATEYVYSVPRLPTDGRQTTFSDSDSGTFNNEIDLCDTAPDIKVSDFFSGILKQFNLICYSVDGINFEIEQLENWYYLGNIKDFSQYTITDFDFNRVKPYKKIDLKYQKCESVLNRVFFDNYKREYGDLSSNFSNDGSDYTIQLPFENILFNGFNTTSISGLNYPLVAYAIKQDLKPYKPKPILLYQTGNIAFTSNWYFGYGGAHFSFSACMMYSQDDDDTAGRTDEVSNVNSLNFGIEISPLYQVPIYRTLYSNYYLNYLNNLYSLKSRMFKVKMRLPYSELLIIVIAELYRQMVLGKLYILIQLQKSH
jgi:hypothetical protein